MFNFFLELEKERYQRVHNALNFLVAEAGLFQPSAMLAKARLLLRQTSSPPLDIPSHSESFPDSFS